MFGQPCTLFRVSLNDDLAAGDVFDRGHRIPNHRAKFFEASLNYDLISLDYSSKKATDEWCPAISARHDDAHLRRCLPKPVAPACLGQVPTAARVKENRNAVSI